MKNPPAASHGLAFGIPELGHSRVLLLPNVSSADTLLMKMGIRVGAPYKYFTLTSGIGPESVIAFKFMVRIAPFLRMGDAKTSMPMPLSRGYSS